MSAVEVGGMEWFVGGMGMGGTPQVPLAISCTGRLLCAPRASLHGRFLLNFLDFQSMQSVLYSRKKYETIIMLVIEVTQRHPCPISPRGDYTLNLEAPELLPKACLIDVTFSIPPTQ